MTETQAPTEFVQTNPKAFNALLEQCRERGAENFNFSVKLNLNTGVAECIFADDSHFREDGQGRIFSIINALVDDQDSVIKWMAYILAQSQNMAKNITIQ